MVSSVWRLPGMLILCSLLWLFQVIANMLRVRVRDRANGAFVCVKREQERAIARTAFLWEGGDQVCVWTVGFWQGHVCSKPSTTVLKHPLPDPYILSSSLCSFGRWMCCVFGGFGSGLGKSEGQMGHWKLEMSGWEMHSLWKNINKIDSKYGLSSWCCYPSDRTLTYRWNLLHQS